MADEVRRIGGSDLPKLLGISKYGNAMDVYLRVIGGMEDVWNSRMERGAMMEPVLRAHGQNHLHLEIEETESDYHKHPSYPFAWAQVDDLARLDGKPVCVDYKSQSRWAKGWGAAGSDVVPESIRAQLAWEMFCVDRDLGVLVTGFGDDVKGPEVFELSHVLIYRVERCPQFEGYCVAVAKEFWEAHVIPRVPPDMRPLGKSKRAKQ